MHAPIILSGKKYVLNEIYEQVSKYVVMIFSSKISIVSHVLNGYGSVLLCMYFMHLVLLDYSMSHYVSNILTIKTMHAQSVVLY